MDFWSAGFYTWQWKGHNNTAESSRIQSSYISSKFWLQIRQLQILHPKNKAKQLFIIMNFKILWTVYIYDIQLVLSLEKLIINSSFALFLGCNIRSCLIWSQKYTKIIFYLLNCCMYILVSSKASNSSLNSDKPKWSEFVFSSSEFLRNSCLRWRQARCSYRTGK